MEIQRAGGGGEEGREGGKEGKREGGGGDVTALPVSLIHSIVGIGRFV